MKILFSRPTKEVVAAVKEGLDNWNQAWFAVAYLSAAGVRQLEPAIRGFVRRGADLRVITTGKGYITQPAALRALWDLGVRDIHFRVASHPRLFHSKVYYFAPQGTGKCRAIVGSANLSDGGFGNNDEAAVLLEGPRSRQEFKSIEKFLDKGRLVSEGFAPLSEELLEAYAQDYKANKPRFSSRKGTHSAKAAKDRKFTKAKVISRSEPGNRYFMATWWPNERKYGHRVQPPEKKDRELYFQNDYRSSAERLRVGDRVILYETEVVQDRKYLPGAGKFFAVVEVTGLPEIYPVSWKWVGNRKFSWNIIVPMKIKNWIKPKRGINRAQGLRILNIGGVRIPSGLTRELDTVRAMKLESRIPKFRG